MTRRPRAAVLLIGLVIVACQSTPSAPPSPESTGPVASGSPAPAATPESSLPAGFITGSGDVFLADGTDGLDSLASYTSKLTSTFEGTKDGAASSWTSATTYSFVREPFMDLLTVDQPTDRPAVFPAWSATADGTEYSQSGKDDCFGSLPEQRAVAAISRNPAARLPGFIGADVTGSENIGGFAADVATLTPAALGWSADTKASGTVAIATTGDYVLRYDLVLEGGPEMFGEGTTGKFTRHYELSDIGTATVTIPAGCPAGLVQGPQPVDAVTVQSLPGYLVLTTKGSVVDTSALYRDTGLAFGWTRGADITINQDLGALKFTADGLAITVAITKIDGGSKIEVIATRT